MSLLEDIFLQDEANEAQELERVIEGDEYDERPRSEPQSEESDNDNGNKEDEAEEDKRRVDPASTKTKKVVKNPRFILNPARLTGPRGIQIIPEHFKDFKFKGKGHEKDDLDMVLKKLEHWAYRLYPKFQFEDCLKKIETLGKKRPVMVHLHKIRTDQFLSEETVVQKDSSDDEAQPPQEEDEFDKLLQQQIDLARATPAPGSVKKNVTRNDQWEKVIETPLRDDRLTMPKATSSPSISDEQKERMIRNRKLAEERRLARLKQATNINNSPTTIIETNENETNENVTTDIDLTGENRVALKDNSSIINSDNIIAIDEANVSLRKNRFFNIIDSDSDEECNVTAVNESIVVDVHDSVADKEKTGDEIGDSRNEQNGVMDHIEDMVVDSGNLESNDTLPENIEVNDQNMGITDKAETENITDKHVVEENIEEVENDSVRAQVVNKENEEINDANTNEDENSRQVQNNTISQQIQENNKIDKEMDQNNPKPANEENVISKDGDELTQEVMDVDFSDDF